MFSMPVVEPNCEPYIWHRVPEWLISFWVAGWLFWPASIKERVAIYTWINTYSWYELSFLQYLYFLKCVCVRGGGEEVRERERCVCPCSWRPEEGKGSVEFQVTVSCPPYWDPNSGPWGKSSKCFHPALQFLISILIPIHCIMRKPLVVLERWYWPSRYP